jgi:undecaprenyl-diphosphatase
MKSIVHFDKWLFTKINRDWSNDFFDMIMPYLRIPSFWIPLYLFLIVFAIVNFPKKALAWILSLGAAVAVSDIISSHVIKPLVGRLRPCNNPDLAETIRLLAPYCGQNGSFTSSHAANHFTIAAFLFITLKSVWGNYTKAFFIWAAMISYAQIYVGVHYPFDVIGGTLLGLIIGNFFGNFYIKKNGTIDQYLKSNSK